MITAILRSPKQLRAAPSRSEQFQAAPSSSEQLRAAPSSSKQLRAAPSSSEQLRAAPSSSEQLRAAPSSSEQLRAAPSSSEQLLECLHVSLTSCERLPPSRLVRRHARWRTLWPSGEVVGPSSHPHVKWNRAGRWQDQRV